MNDDFALKDKLLVKQDSRCYFCVNPLSVFDSKLDENNKVICKDCERRKGAMTELEYFEVLGGRALYS